MKILVIGSCVLDMVVNVDHLPDKTEDVNDTNETGDNNTSENGSAIIDPNVEAGTRGEALWNAFLKEIKDNDQITMQELADTLLQNPVIAFMGGAVPLEASQEYFVGFDEYKIEGYESGAIYMPMIGSIPFVGYVFRLNDGVDAKGFISNLTSNCNPSWNICVTADQTVAGAVDNVVFFLMCRAAIED